MFAETHTDTDTDTGTDTDTDTHTHTQHTHTHTHTQTHTHTNTRTHPNVGLTIQMLAKIKTIQSLGCTAEPTGEIYNECTSQGPCSPL